MRVILLILFILLIGQLIVNLFVIIKNVDKYQLEFIRKLHDKMIEKYNYIIKDLFEEFEELFQKYREGRRDTPTISEGGFVFLILLLYMMVSDAFLLIGVLLQTCRDCMKICRGVFVKFYLLFVMFYLYII